MKQLKKLSQNPKIQRLFQIGKARFTEAEVGNNSVVVAYYLLLSLFPLLIAVGNLLPFLRIDPNSILPYMKEVIPAEIYSFLGPAIENLLTKGSGGVLSLSALATIWSASKSINALQNALNKAYGVEQRSNFVVVRLVSLIVMLLFMVAIIGVTLVLGLGKAILEGLQPIFHFSHTIIDTFQSVKWPLAIVTLLVIMVVIYGLVPNAKVKLRSALPGALFATIGWLLLGQVFGIYADFFAGGISGYQIIGSFIVLMLWLNFAATIIILGGILNAIIEEYVSGSALTEKSGPVSQLSEKIEDKLKKSSESE